MTMRYRCYGRDDFGHPYDALSTEDLDGDWVRFEDYELLRASRDMWETAAKNIGLESCAAQTALRSIKDMTNVDNPDSYRCDDREGCLDSVFSTASEALTQSTSEGGK